MTKEELYKIEKEITALVENQVLFDAVKNVAADACRAADEAVVLGVREGDIRKAQLYVGRKDGIEEVLATLKRVAIEYRRKTTSDS